MSQTLRTFVLFLGIAVAVTGCKNLLQKKAMDTTSDVLWAGRPSLKAEADPDVAAAAIPASLKTVEAFWVANPTNPKLTAILAEGWCQYATGFIQDGAEAAKMAGNYDESDHLNRRATGMYIRCINYSLKMLPKKWGENIFGQLATVESMVKSARKKDVPGMLWLAIGIASAINVNRDDITMVSHLPKAKLILERIVELDDDYNHGYAHIGLGMLHTARSKHLGGTPDVGKKHFDRVIEITEGKFLLAKVLFAFKYAVITQDRELFHKTLVEVLRTSPAIWPEQRLANELAHRKARRYLKYEADLF